MSRPSARKSMNYELESTALIYLPFVVVAEIRAGGLVTRKGQNQVRILQQFLNEPGVKILHSGDCTTHHYSMLYMQLRKNGTPISANDLWIAALAKEHDLILYSRDRHFDAIPSLVRMG